MTVRSALKLPAAAVPVFIIGKGRKLDNHQFLKALRPGDKKHLISVVRAFAAKEEYARVTALPSGRKAVVVSLGERPLTLRRAILLARRIITLAKAEKIKSPAVLLDDFAVEGSSRASVAELLAIQFTLAHFDFTAHKTAPKEGWPEVREAYVIATPDLIRGKQSLF